jgi:hypothetical protein
MAVQVRATYKLTGWNSTQLKEEIQTVQFDWPRATKRRNRSTVTSPRDVVDLGGFLRSQRRDRPSATQLRFTWDARSDKGFPYAPLILTGYTTRRGTIVPGRNWIKPALEAVPLDQFFAREWRRLASNRL